MCTKWVIFVIFLKLEYVILAVVEIVPLGTLALLIVKFLLFMPENPISHMIYKYVQKRLEKIKMDEYTNEMGKWLSISCKYIVIVLMKVVKKLAEYVHKQDIEMVEVTILELVRILEYKKAAINLRNQVFKSEINKDELADTELNTSMSSEDEGGYGPQVQVEGGEKENRKTETAVIMSKILEDVDEREEDKGKIKLIGKCVCM
jgi:hypothetical protein